MAVGEIPVTWRVIAHTVRGASHVRSGLPNQDAYACLTASDGLPQTVVAISDGHGSESCFRSDVGSKLVIVSATERIQQQLDAAGVTQIIGTDDIYLGNERVGATLERAVADATTWIERAPGPQ